MFSGYDIVLDGYGFILYTFYIAGLHDVMDMLTVFVLLPSLPEGGDRGFTRQLK